MNETIQKTHAITADIVQACLGGASQLSFLYERDRIQPIEDRSNSIFAIRTSIGVNQIFEAGWKYLCAIQSSCSPNTSTKQSRDEKYLDECIIATFSSQSKMTRKAICVIEMFHEKNNRGDEILKSNRQQLKKRIVDFMLASAELFETAANIYGRDPLLSSSLKHIPRKMRLFYVKPYRSNYFGVKAQLDLAEVGAHDAEILTFFNEKYSILCNQIEKCKNGGAALGDITPTLVVNRIKNVLTESHPPRPPH